MIKLTGINKIYRTNEDVYKRQAEGEAHLFAATQFAARLVPHVAGKEVTVEDGFHFMFRQVAVVESFCLLEYAALITDEGVFLLSLIHI